MTTHSASKHCRTWKAITRQKVEEDILWKWNVSLLPAGKCVCAMNMHIFQMMMMKERFKSAWRWKRCLRLSLDSLFSVQVSSTHFSISLYLPSTFPSPSPNALHTALHTSIAIQASHSAVRSPFSRLNKVIFAHRRPLIGSQWCSKDFDGQIETNGWEFRRGCCIMPPRTNWFSCSKSLSQLSGIKQKNECLANNHTHTHTMINWRSRVWIWFIYTCRTKENRLCHLNILMWIHLFVLSCIILSVLLWSSLNSELLSSLVAKMAMLSWLGSVRQVTGWSLQFVLFPCVFCLFFVFYATSTRTIIIFSDWHFIICRLAFLCRFCLLLSRAILYKYIWHTTNI